MSTTPDTNPAAATINNKQILDCLFWAYYNNVT